MKPHDVVDLLTALKTLDPRGFVTVDATTIQVWHTVMEKTPAIAATDAMQTAYELVAKPGATFPTPGDFRALVAETVSNLPSVEDARRQVERALKENYPGMPPKYTPDAPVLEALRQIGGPTMFRSSQNEQATGALWRQFDAAYRGIRDRQVSPAVRDISTSPALDGGNGVKALKERTA